MPLRKGATIELSQAQRSELEKVARSRRTPQAVAQRARIVLMTADGVLPGAIGEQLGVSQPTIRKWRARFVEQGLPGLRSEPRPGRPRTLDDQRVADLLNQALQTRPAKQTHWSVRSLCCRWGWATSKASLTTTFGTARPRCLLRSMWPTARSSRVFERSIGIRRFFLDFLRQIDKQTPPELDLHLIVGNYVTHKHGKVTRIHDIVP